VTAISLLQKILKRAKFSKAKNRPGGFAKIAATFIKALKLRQNAQPVLIHKHTSKFWVKTGKDSRLTRWRASPPNKTAGKGDVVLIFTPDENWFQRNGMEWMGLFCYDVARMDSIAEELHATNSGCNEIADVMKRIKELQVDEALSEQYKAALVKMLSVWYEVRVRQNTQESGGSLKEHNAILLIVNRVTQLTSERPTNENIAEVHQNMQVLKHMKFYSERTEAYRDECRKELIEMLIVWLGLTP